MSHFLLNGGQDVSKAQVAALRERSGDFGTFYIAIAGGVLMWMGCTPSIFTQGFFGILPRIGSGGKASGNFFRTHSVRFLQHLMI
jgi:hypothetical protein